MIEFRSVLRLMLNMSLLWIPFHGLMAQCHPYVAEICDGSHVSCSLDEIDGLVCNNPSTVPSDCSPLCSEGGIPNNTSWWAFVSQGGNATITLTIGDCFYAQGLQFGIWGDCDCREDIACKSVPCIPPNSVQVINAHLKACKTYYLWVDGCSSDVCEFTVNTSGGAAPSLSPLGFINNLPAMVIEPVCIGACNFRFFIDPQSGGCEPTYVWTLDGDEVAGNSDEIYLDFPDEGNFILCVNAYIGNTKSGSICSQKGPRCATIKVRPTTDRIGKDRIICPEKIRAGGFKWHSQRIFTSGEYREQFTDSTCCKYDSVVFFNVPKMDIPDPPDVYYISCDNEPYVDVLGNVWEGCRNQYEILLPNTTDPYHCDSSILLTSVYVDYSANLKLELRNDTLIYHPNIRINHPCNVGEIYYFSYKWKYKSDTTGLVLSTDEHFLPQTSADYILDVEVSCILGTDTVVCSRRFEEHFTELEEARAATLQLEKYVCPTDTSWAKAIPWGMVPSGKFNWQIPGGQILSNPDSSSVQIIWNLTPGTEAYVQFYYSIDSIRSKTAICTIHTISPQIVGRDFSIFGKLATLSAMSKIPGMWTIVLAPFSALIADPMEAKTSVEAEGFGTYCFEWFAPLNNCADRDTICINFKNIITYDDKEERKHEKGDSLSGKMITRSNNQINEYIKLLYYNKEYLTFNIQKEIKTASQLSFLDLQGRLIHSMDVKENRLPGNYIIPLPKLTGVCYIRWTLDSDQYIYKIFVPQ